MAKVQISIENIKELEDGKVAAEFNAELRRVVSDMMERPTVKGPRKVTLTANIEPIVNSEHSCEEADITFEVSAKMPGRRSMTFRPSARSHKNRGAGLFVNPASPDDPQQATLDEV